MNLHYETVSPLLKETLQKLVNSPIFKDFTLIGGTCLSLQLGHRRSIDIDLFTDIDYGTMNTKEMKEFIQRSFPYSENTDSLDTSALGYTLYMGDSPIDKIKVDFFYTEKFIFPIQEIDHIRNPIFVFSMIKFIFMYQKYVYILLFKTCRNTNLNSPPLLEKINNLYIKLFSSSKWNDYFRGY